MTGRGISPNTFVAVQPLKSGAKGRGKGSQQWVNRVGLAYIDHFRSTPENGHTTDPYLGSAPCPLRKHRDDREVGKLPSVGAAPIRRRSHFSGSGVW